MEVGGGDIHGRRKQDCFCSNLLRWGKGRESEDGDFREGNLIPVYFLLCAPRPQYVMCQVQPQGARDGACSGQQVAELGQQVLRLLEN